MNAVTPSTWTMDQNEFQTALFGRPVLFKCKICERVNVPDPAKAVGEVWEKAHIFLDTHNVRLEHLWWFHTICDLCQHSQRS